jgi:hypothetical protein
MTTDKHKITSSDEPSRKEDKSESLAEDTHIGETARINGFSGNLDNCELENVENFDPSHAIMEG